MTSYHTLAEIRDDIQQGVTNCEQLVQHYLAAIKEKSHLNAFVEVYEEEAIARAREVDQKLASGKAGKLAGMVVGLKDVLCHKDHGLQSASKILAGFESQFNGTAVERLLNEDAIIIGRQNCDEFAMGSTTETSTYGPARNDIDNNRVPGGSSGGSAVSVQAGLCHASLGSDTGGSVRQPASFCGIIGLKPTYSRISRYGLAAYASSFDCIGILAKSVEDTALLLEVIAGADAYDSTVSRREVPEYSKNLNFNEKISVGYIQEGLDDGVDSEVRECLEATIDGLKAQGHTVAPVAFPYMDYMLPTYYILTMAEASSNLARYDGVRYGYRSENTHDLASMYKKTRTEGFGKEVKKRIMLGTFVLSAGYYDAYYTKAQKMRRLIKEKTEELLQQHTFLLLPTSSVPAFTIGEMQDSLSMYLADLFTVQASLAGVPAVSLPAGHTRDGLPIGMQLMGRPFEEKSLLAFSGNMLKN